MVTMCSRRFATQVCNTLPPIPDAETPPPLARAAGAATAAVRVDDAAGTGAGAGADVAPQALGRLLPPPPRWPPDRL